MELKGFHINTKIYESYTKYQYNVGLRVLDKELPCIKRSLQTILHDFSLSNSSLSDNLPSVAGFGYIHGILLHEIRGGDKNMVKNVGLCSSILNICIGIFDYIVDEVENGNGIFKIINHQLLQNLMDISSDISEFEKKILHTNKVYDKIEYLLLSLIIAFGLCCRGLYDYSKDDVTWKELFKVLQQMRYAEKITSEIQTRVKIMKRGNLLRQIKYKSVMPSLSMYTISKLASPGSSKNHENNAKEIAHTMGNIFWIADDLADVSEDIQSGHPSYITTNLSVPSYVNMQVGEKAFNETIICSIEYLLNLLEKLKKQLNSKSISHDISSKVMEFVSISIATWLADKRI